MMKVQQLIKEIGYDEAVKYLKNELHIMVKEYDNFGVFNYNQIFSPEVDDYVIECRGLILDKNGEVLGRRWNRFFNYGQQPDITGKFEFEGSEIFEKVDGCLEENTIIDTEDGLKTIKEICDSEYFGKVKSYNHDSNSIEYTEILAHSIKDSVDNWYKVTLENGHSIIVTGNHGIYLTNYKCYRDVDKLQVGDNVDFNI